MTAHVVLQENDENVPSDWSRHGKTYCIAVTPSDDADSSEAQAEVAMELLFAHTPNYPGQCRVAHKAGVALCGGGICCILQHHVQTGAVFGIGLAQSHWNGSTHNYTLGY